MLFAVHTRVILLETHTHTLTRNSVFELKLILISNFRIKNRNTQKYGEKVDDYEIPIPKVKV